MILLLTHFETGDASCRYWVEYRTINTKDASEKHIKRAINTIIAKHNNEDLDYDAIVDRALTMIYGCSGWGYFNNLCGEKIDGVLEVFI